MYKFSLNYRLNSKDGRFKAYIHYLMLKFTNNLFYNFDMNQQRKGSPFDFLMENSVNLEVR